MTSFCCYRCEPIGRTKAVSHLQQKPTKLSLDSSCSWCQQRQRWKRMVSTIYKILAFHLWNPAAALSRIALKAWAQNFRLFKLCAYKSIFNSSFGMWSYESLQNSTIRNPLGFRTDSGFQWIEGQFTSKTNSAFKNVQMGHAAFTMNPNVSQLNRLSYTANMNPTDIK